MSIAADRSSSSTTSPSPTCSRSRSTTCRAPPRASGPCTAPSTRASPCSSCSPGSSNSGCSPPSSSPTTSSGPACGCSGSPSQRRPSRRSRCSRSQRAAVVSLPAGTPDGSHRRRGGPALRARRRRRRAARAPSVRRRIAARRPATARLLLERDGPRSSDRVVHAAGRSSRGAVRARVGLEPPRDVPPRRRRCDWTAVGPDGAEERRRA